MAALMVGAVSLLGQQTPNESRQMVRLEKVAKRLDLVEASRVWQNVKHQVPTSRPNGGKSVDIATSGLQITQVPGVMEVTGVAGGAMRVFFETTQPLPVGSILIFQFTTPDGTQVPMQSFQLFGDGFSSSEGWNVSEELWNGPFPLAWLAGWTNFGAVVVLPSGKIMYTSATVAVNACCALDGPIDRADVTPDGSAVTIQGSFSGETFATVNSNPVPISFPLVGSKVNTVGKIPLDPAFGQGQMVLTVCSGGICSTRIIYVSSGSSGKG